MKVGQVRILGIITARGGSKGIPRKNIKNLNGKPLLYYTAIEAKKSKKINRLVISSDDDEIISTAVKYGIEAPYKRPKELARDNTPTLPVITDLIRYLKRSENYNPDIIVLLQPTSPFRKAFHIDEAIDKYMTSKSDSLVSVVKVPHNYNPYSLMQTNYNYIESFLKFDEKNNLRQNKPIFFARNGAIYIFNMDCIKNESLYGKKIIPYEMSELESLDIDTNWDFELAKILMKKEKNENKI